MKKREKQEKAITLIALVLTIIVLLILAGISIQAITNQGIFGQANRAIDEQTKASMKEQIAIYVSEATYDYYLNNPKEKSYLEFIAKYLENKEDVLIDIVEQNEDEVILNYTQGKNIVQLLLSSDGTLEIIGSGTTSSGIEDTYAPKISYVASTRSSITVTLKDSSGVVEYAYLLENSKPNIDSNLWNEIGSAPQTKEITITGLETEKTYYIFAKDAKGNISEGTVCKTEEYTRVTVVYKESSTATEVLETVNTHHTAEITLISKPSILVKSGYDFVGWSEREDAKEALDTEYTVPDHNVILYPVWKKSEVSISLVGAVGEKISVYDGETLLGTATLNSSGVSSQNITVPTKDLKFVGSISEYEKTIEVTSDVKEVKVMPEGALYWYGYKNGFEISLWGKQSNAGGLYWNTNSFYVSRATSMAYNRSGIGSNLLDLSTYSKIVTYTSGVINGGQSRVGIVAQRGELSDSGESVTWIVSDSLTEKVETNIENVDSGYWYCHCDTYNCETRFFGIVLEN